VRDILCPIDFSPASGKALQYAARLARETGAALTVLFVNAPLLEVAGASAYDGRALRQSTESELRRFAQRAIAKSRGRRLAPKYIVTVGDPPEQIQKTARRLKSDVVVMGTHGATGLTKLLFGSTTERFLGLATMPVLLIPPARR
jgi:nucleotide-binding universal stress UspA family protein